MRNYLAPVLEIKNFDDEDILTASLGLGGKDNAGTANGNWEGWSD